MKDKVEKVLSRSLLPCDSEVALLKSFKVVHAIVSKKIQTELHAFHLLDYKLNDLKWVTLLVYLFYDVRLLDKDRVNELHELMFKGDSFLAELAVEYSSVINI